MGNNHCEIRNSKYVVPKFKDEFVRKRFNYNLIKVMNNTPSIVKDKAYTHSKQDFVNYSNIYTNIYS